MFNLTETWKNGYKQFLKEEQKRFDKDFSETIKGLQESQKEAEAGFNAIQEYFNIYALNEDDENWSKPGVVSGTDEDQKQKKNNEIASASAEKSISEILKLFAGNLVANSTPTETIIDKGSYKPIEGIKTVQKIGDMKFPQNIIFFLKQLVSWIVRVVIYYVEKFKNLLRGLLGAPLKTLDPNQKKLNLEKEIPSEYMIPLNPNDRTGAPIKAYKVDSKYISNYITESAKAEEKALLEDNIFAEIGKALKSQTPATKDKGVQKDKQMIIVSLDFSKDLMDMKQLVQHFFDLFDNAFGSNNENLYGTDDLELILRVFDSTVENMKKGKTNTYEIDGNLAEISAISADRVYDNLVNTNTNLTNLKECYQQTFDKINDVAKIINNKELLSAADMGINFKYLTMNTKKSII